MFLTFVICGVYFTQTNYEKRKGKRNREFHTRKQTVRTKRDENFKSESRSIDSNRFKGSRETIETKTFINVCEKLPKEKIVIK